MSQIEDLLARSAAAGERLQRIADQMSDRAALRAIYGVSNSELDKVISDNHLQALKELLDIGDQLEKAAVAAGFLTKGS
ncbi:hypothetical protein OLZ32_22110 [Rhizobium sp. 1AS11]|uniref:hypothetical protein n=1 Tax=Rhizobium acaciae TaxID=2989736 RepID=UPI0022229232|nr:hypothetical protein [Rhizobium acaciae]MCW1411071.1 hypothetical protein [Rhizobium acaciae]MCW1743077.1 hypothetical protein [Rhizobium acaciae]